MGLGEDDAKPKAKAKHKAASKVKKTVSKDEKEAKDWVQTDKGGKAVDEEVEQARMNQITGVPNFTIQGKYEVGGAQDSGVFLRLFEKIKATEQGAKA